MRRNTCRYVPIMLAFAFAGCGETLSGPGAEPDELERTLVTDAIEAGSKLAWLPGSDLVAVLVVEGVAPSGVLRVVNVATGSVIDAGAVCGPADSGHAWGYDLVTASDGSTICYVCDGQLGFTTASGAQVTLLRTNACPHIGLSPDGALLAYAECGWEDDDPHFQDSGYVQPDTLFVRDLERGHETYLKPFGWPIAFSPDGAELLYETYDPTTWGMSVRRLTIADGSEREVFQYDGNILWPYLYRWDAQGLHLLYSEHDPWGVGVPWVKSLTTGETVRFELPQSPYGLGNVYEWSVDGSRLAFDKRECMSSMQGSHGSECALYRHTLWVSNPYTARSVRVAYSDDPYNTSYHSWTDGRFPSAATVEPNGRRIVYFLREGLFLSELP